LPETAQGAAGFPNATGRYFVARLRVGDIEIDGQNITMGGRRMTTGTRVETTLAPRPEAALAPPRQEPSSLARRGPEDELAALERLPGSPRTLVAGGLAMMLLGVVAAIFAGSPSLAVIFASGGFLLPMGAGVAGLGVFKTRLTRRRRSRDAARIEAEMQPEIERVRATLSEGPIGPTVEEIAQRVSLPQGKVVRALAWLRERGEVLEELNTETGEWFYCLAPPLERRAKDLDSRLEALEAVEERSFRR
jgi:hypothetical protein